MRLNAPSTHFVMLYVYVLKDKADKTLYDGYTNNVQRRLDEHNKNGFWELVYYEAFRSERDARKQERSLKQYGQSRTHLKKRIAGSISYQQN